MVLISDESDSDDKGEDLAVEEISHTHADRDDIEKEIKEGSMVLEQRSERQGGQRPRSVKDSRWS
jgi:hypothetical protein